MPEAIVPDAARIRACGGTVSYTALCRGGPLRGRVIGARYESHPDKDGEYRIEPDAIEGVVWQWYGKEPK